MSPHEAIQLTGYLQGYFPHQPVNEFTPDALVEALATYPIADAEQAVRQLAARGDRWCAPSDVLAEIKRIRGKRIAEAGDLIPPAGLTEAQERTWLGRARATIGDGGAVDNGRHDLVRRPVAELLSKAGASE